MLAFAMLCPFSFREHYIMIRKLFCLQYVRRLRGKSHGLCVSLLIYIIKIISPLLQNNVKIMDKMLVKSSQFGVMKEIHFSEE